MLQTYRTNKLIPKWKEEGGRNWEMGTGAGARATAAMRKVGHEWKRAVQHGELYVMLPGDLHE